MRGKRSSSLTNTTEKAQSRKTALVVAGVLALLAGLKYYRGRLVTAEVLAAIAATLALVGLFIPALAVRFHRGWMKLAEALGYVNSRILLSLVYFLAITPLGLIKKIFGSDPLARRAGRGDSYWIRRPIARQSKEQFEQSF